MPASRTTLRSFALACIAIALLCTAVWAVSGWGGVAYVWRRGSLSIGNGSVDYHNQVSSNPDDRQASVVWRSTNPPSWYSILEADTTHTSGWLMIPLWLISLLIALLGGSLLLLSRRPARPLTDSPGRRLRRTLGSTLMVLMSLTAAFSIFSCWYTCQYTYSGWVYRTLNGRFGYASTPGGVFAPTFSDGFRLFRTPPEHPGYGGRFGAPLPRFTTWPFWPVPLLLGTVGGALLLSARTRSPSTCPICSYDRRGIPASVPCPECGAPAGASPPRTHGATPIDSPPNLPPPPTGTA